MSEINLNALNLDELHELSKSIEHEIKSRSEQKKNEALAAVAAKAQEMGFSLDELVAANGKKGKASLSAPKYVHPENPSVTWTGKGRQPRWIKDGLASGKSLDDFRIAI